MRFILVYLLLPLVAYAQKSDVQKVMSRPPIIKNKNIQIRPNLTFYSTIESDLKNGIHRTSL